MLILHVGPQKTATTWLQHNFFNNRETLLKAGWYYPRTGVRVRVAHHDLSDRPNEIFDEKSEKVKKIREINKYSQEHGLNVLLSAEGFRSWGPKHLSRIVELMHPHKVKIVYTLRDPVSVIYSTWMQIVKNGSMQSFPEFHERHFKNPGRSRLLNPLMELRAIESVPNTELVVIPYDEIKRQKRDIFDIFIEEILKLPRMPHSDRAIAGNDSFPIEQIEFIRLMLLRMGNWKQRTKVSMGQMFRHVIGKDLRDEIIAKVGKVNEAQRQLRLERDTPEFRWIEKHLIHRYEDRFVPTLKSRKLFLEGAENCTYMDRETLEADPAVSALLDDLVRTYRPGAYRFMVITWSATVLRFMRKLTNKFRH